MIQRDHIKSLAHKLIEAKSEGERLRVVEEESRRLLGGDRESPEPGCPYRIPRDREGLRARWQRKRSLS